MSHILRYVTIFIFLKSVTELTTFIANSLKLFWLNWLNQLKVGPLAAHYLSVLEKDRNHDLSDEPYVLSLNWLQFQWNCVFDLYATRLVLDGEGHGLEEAVHEAEASGVALHVAHDHDVLHSSVVLKSLLDLLVGEVLNSSNEVSHSRWVRTSNLTNITCPTAC